MEATAVHDGRRDYYAVLGVARGVGREELRSAFRGLARMLHPDVSAEPLAQERFAEVTEAYRVLSNPSARVLYDNFGYRGRGNGGFDLDHPWVAFRRARERGEEVGEVEIDEAEAAGGVRRRLVVASTGRCTACGASSDVTAVTPACWACGGTGTIRTMSQLSTGPWLQVERCADCDGTGRTGRPPCEECGGRGREPKERRVRVTIPAGTRDGERIELPDGAAVFVRLRRAPAGARLVHGVAVFGLLLALAFLAFLILG